MAENFDDFVAGWVSGVAGLMLNEAGDVSSDDDGTRRFAVFQYWLRLAISIQ